MTTSKLDDYTEQCLKKFPARLLQILYEKGMRKSDLARQLETSWSTVGVWCKSGRLPDSYNLVRLACILDVSVDWLLGLTDAR